MKLLLEIFFRKEEEEEVEALVLRGKAQLEEVIRQGVESLTGDGGVYVNLNAVEATACN